MLVRSIKDNYMSPRQTSITFAIAVFMIGALVGISFLMMKNKSIERKNNNIHYVTNAK